MYICCIPTRNADDVRPDCAGHTALLSCPLSRRASRHSKQDRMEMMNVYRRSADPGGCPPLTFADICKFEIISMKRKKIGLLKSIIQKLLVSFEAQLIHHS